MNSTTHTRCYMPAPRTHHCPQGANHNGSSRHATHSQGPQGLRCTRGCLRCRADRPQLKQQHIFQHNKGIERERMHISTEHQHCRKHNQAGGSCHECTGHLKSLPADHSTWAPLGQGLCETREPNLRVGQQANIHTPATCLRAEAAQGDKVTPN